LYVEIISQNSMLGLYTVCWDCTQYAGIVHSSMLGAHSMLGLYAVCWDCTPFAGIWKIRWLENSSKWKQVAALNSSCNVIHLL